MNIELRKYQKKDELLVKNILAELEFDFVVSLDNFRVMIAESDVYDDFIFISNFGISKIKRGCGFARLFIAQIKKYYQKTIYLYTIIPEFYLKLNFTCAPEFNAVAKNPKECALCCQENCVAMKG